ncbi:MAG: hypothetical protein M0R51_08505 [Clostridia bacterium]|jgi:hypothetical protein|nr:hypothetical protein [Clostridia bacterium]
MKIRNILFIAIVLFALTDIASAVENTEIGEIEIYEINATESNTMPKGVIPYLLTTGSISSDHLRFDSVNHTIDITRNSTVSGQVWMGGFYPATNQNLTFTISLDRDDWNANANIKTNNAYVVVTRASNGDYYIDTYGKNVGASRLIDTSHHGKPLTFSIVSNDTTRKNTIKTTTGEKERSYYSTTNGLLLPYPAVFTPVIYIYADKSIATYCTVKVHSIKQSIPAYEVTPFCVGDLQSFGIDGPHEISTIQNGISLMQSNDQTCTIWADIDFLDSGRTEYIKALMEDGFELGIHFNENLNTKDLQDAYDEIDLEMEYMNTVFGEYPKTWCALQNSDNVSHAAYIYTNYGAYWRNGYSGGYWSSNLANLNELSNTFWGPAAENKIIYPTMSHQLDVTPAISTSTEPALMTLFSNMYKENNVQICSFYQYYQSSIAQNNTEIEVIEAESDHTIFMITDNGFPCNIYVNNSGTVYKGWDLKESSSISDGKLIHDATTGYYTVGSEEYFIINKRLYVDPSLTATWKPYGIYDFDREIIETDIIAPINIFPTTDTEVNITISTWETDSKTWTESSEIHDIITSHILGGFPSNKEVDIYVDGIKYVSPVSSSTGYITFTYSGGFSEHDFEAIVATDANLMADGNASIVTNSVAMISVLVIVAMVVLAVALLKGKVVPGALPSAIIGLLIVMLCIYAMYGIATALQNAFGY